ncbi:MAG: thioredoxin-dependent peroxiredoxin [bacterium]
MKDGCVQPARGPILTTTTGIEEKQQPKSEVTMIARVGAEATDFEAHAFIKGVGFKTVKLSDYKGRWIVVCFYPGDFTFVCPTELAAVAAHYDELKSMDVEVLSISTDSRFVHKIWQEEELSKMIEGGVPFPMLSDPGGKIGKVYGVYDEAAGVNIRGRFIIDPDFVIRAMEVLTPEVGRNPDELIRQIRAFQHTRSTGEVTPSGWHPGQVTLKPGPQLVGKVWEVWKP